MGSLHGVSQGKGGTTQLGMKGRGGGKAKKGGVSLLNALEGLILPCQPLQLLAKLFSLQDRLLPLTQGELGIWVAGPADLPHHRAIMPI